jgi:selenocysteine lyase/cysteine desulfurase
MTHRRLFLKQLAAVAGAAQVATLFAVDRAIARETRELGAAEFRHLRARYLLDPDVVYFNHGSIGTIPRVVHEAQVAYLRLCETNPWLYMWSDPWEQLREAVREKAADFLGCDASEIVFTHNTTEGFNILAHGLPVDAGDEVVFSSLNHDGASICWFQMARTRGITVTRFDFPIHDVPRMTVDEILGIYDRHLGPRTRVLVFPHVDNVVGLRHPVRELVALARNRGVEFVAVDGAQTVGMLDVDVHELGADFYCASPHKWLQAPKGLGLMHIRSNMRERLRPMWVTWGQERWKGTSRVFEDYGTRNLAEVITLGDAIDFQEGLGSDRKLTRYRELWQRARARTEASPKVAWRSPDQWGRSASLYALEIADRKSRYVFDSLYHHHGFVFRPFETLGLNTIRISTNVANTEDEIEQLFDALERV